MSAQRKSRKVSSLPRFSPGDEVRVPFGVSTFPATVTEVRHGKVYVDIWVEGVDEPMQSFYFPDELAESA